MTGLRDMRGYFFENFLNERNKCLTSNNHIFWTSGQCGKIDIFEKEINTRIQI